MGNFANSLQILRQRGLQGNMSPYSPTVDQPQDTSQGNPYSPQAPDIQTPQQAPPQLPTQQLDLNQPTSDMRNEVGGELASAYAPPQVGKARQILGAIIGAKNPGLGEVVTGDAQRQRQIQGLTGEYGALQNTIQAQQAQRTAELAAQNVGSEIQARNAQSGLTPVTMSNGSTVYLPEKDAAKLIGTQTTAGARTGAAQIGANARVQAAKLGLGPVADVPQELQDQFGLPSQLPLKMLNQAEGAANRPLTIVYGENGPSLINKEKSSTGNLGVGNASLGRGTQIGDENNPGNTTFSTIGNAIRTGAAGPQSASVVVPKQAEKSAVPTDIGNQTVAFKTMVDHAGLLRQAVQALGNGNIQALNGLKNAFKIQFGYSGPITAQAIADAYNAEVAGVLNKGHITDKDLGTTAKTLDVAKMSYPQIDSVLAAYQGLGQRKMNNLNDVTKGAVNASQPNARQQPQIPEGATATNQQNGHKIKFTNGAWVDAVTGQPIQ